MRSSPNDARRFRTLVRNHYKSAGRHTLPWRHTRDPYAIVVSEIMLQQTQVTRVLFFYPRFLKKFPSFRTLAKAPLRDVLAAWQGLGYNRRAAALHRLAKEIARSHKGILPRDLRMLEALPGIGPATAGSILAFAFGVSVPFVETNIRRAFLHHFFPRARNVKEEEIVRLVKATLPKRGAREWYYALMDYGSWLAKQTENPNRRHARYRRSPRFEGSSRELRGKIVRYLLSHPRAGAHVLARALKEPFPRVERALTALKKEGLAT